MKNTVSNLTREATQQHVRRVTWLGMCVNILLAIAKCIIGHIAHSQAVFADGVHSFSDMITDVVVLTGSYIWAKPADKNHPYGHYRIETIATAVIGLLLASAAIGIGWHALFNTAEYAKPGWLAAGIAVVSFVVKEALYRITVRVGKKAGSPAVVANAWHHRTDAFSSLPVIVTVAIAAAFPSLAFADRIGAVIVAAFIIKVAWNIAAPAIAELSEQGASQETYEKISEIVTSITGVRDVHKIRTRRIGYSILVDLHVVVNETITVAEGHDIATTVARTLYEKGPHIIDVVVHIEPDNPDAYE